MEENRRNCGGAGGNGLSGTLLPVITGKEGMVQRSPLRRGMATYWFLKGEMQAGQSCSSTT